MKRTTAIAPARAGAPRRRRTEKLSGAAGRSVRAGGSVALYLAKHPKLALPVDFTRMADQVRTMVRESLDSLVRNDPALARRVIDLDDAVDRDHRQVFVLLQDAMSRDAAIIKRVIALLSSSRYLERIADHATNICEDLIFRSNGEIIRHRTEAFEE